MGNKVTKVCSLDYNPLVSQRSRVRERRASRTDARARAGRFPSLRETLSEERRDWYRWWYFMKLGTTTVPGQP